MTVSAHTDTPRLLAHRVVEPSPLALLGGVLAIVACFLPWEDMAGVAYDDVFEVPLQFLWGIDASGGSTLGLPLVIVAATTAVLSLSSLAVADFLRRLGGVVLLGAVALFVVQLGRRYGWDALDAGTGAWLTGAGGLLALLAPSGLWPLTRDQPQRVPGEAPPAMPAGWYSDPEREGRRYWDGEDWTDHRTG
jgi:hypothetical protein